MEGGVTGLTPSQVNGLNLLNASFARTMRVVATLRPVADLLVAGNGTLPAPSIAGAPCPFIQIDEVQFDPDVPGELIITLAYESDCVREDVGGGALSGASFVTVDPAARTLSVTSAGLSIEESIVVGTIDGTFEITPDNALVVRASFDLTFTSGEGTVGFATVEYRSDGTIALTDGFWRFGGLTADYQLRDPSVADSPAMVVDPRGNMDMLPSAGRGAAGTGAGRIEQLFTPDAPMTREIQVLIAGEGPFDYTIPEYERVEQ